MANFCLQCAEELFGTSETGIKNDFIGLSTEEDTKQEKYVEVLCEGCGYTLVDHTGRCQGFDCFKKH